MQRIIPYLLYEDVSAMLTWLEKAFGFRETGEKVTMPDGRVNHAAMQLGDALVMMGWPGPQYQNPKRLGQATLNLYVMVDDVDTHYEQARQAGATILQQPQTMVYGDRRYGAADPEGHHWYFAQRVANPVEPSTGKA